MTDLPEFAADPVPVQPAWHVQDAPPGEGPSDEDQDDVTEVERP